MKKLDRAAFSVILVSILLLSGVIFIGNRVPLNITCQLPAQCKQVGPFGSVLFEFSRPAQANQVENLWQTIPGIAGKWVWLDNQHARWDSLKPLPTNQKITLQIGTGQAGQNGEQISSVNRWEVTVRPPRIIVTRNEGNGSELFTIGLDDGTSSGKQLTHTNGQIFDYIVTPDGEAVIFSAVNDLKGSDLWMVQRDASNQHKILDCGADLCSTPALSPISQELAYTRESAGTNPNGSKKAPRIWILDVSSGQTAPLFVDPKKIGYGPKWSPNGQWLSISSGSKGGIQVVNRKSGDTYFLESSNGDTGCWSPDSQYLYYSDMVSGEGGFRNVILKADIGSRSIITFFGGNAEGGGISVDNPVCDPQGKWLAVTVQPNVSISGKELELLNPDAKPGVSIMDDLSRIPGFLSWTPDGNLLVYQSLLLGGDGNNVEVWVWDQNTAKARKITDEGRSPQWLP